MEDSNNHQNASLKTSTKGYYELVDQKCICVCLCLPCLEERTSEEVTEVTLFYPH